MAAKPDVLSNLINTGIGLVLGFVGKLFKGKVKGQLSDLNNAAATLQAKDAKQNQTILFLFIGLGIVLAVVLFIFVLKKKK